MQVRVSLMSRSVACALALVVTSPFAVAAASARAHDACRVIGKSDIVRLLGWNVEHVLKRKYRFGSLSGTMCTYESSEGIVSTIMPDPGSAFPGISADNTPDSSDLVQTLDGLGARVQIFNGAVFVTRDRRRVAVRVVPESHPASYADLEPFAKVIVARFP